MKRFIYTAGINTRPLATGASSCRYWLLSATLLRRKDGLPDWIRPYLVGRFVMWDPGTITENAISYLSYRRFLDQHTSKHDEYLQYDEIGDPEATDWYLSDMRKRGYRPIPVLQPGGDLILLKQPRVAIGGLVGMTDDNRQIYLDRLFYEEKRDFGQIHLLGMSQQAWFKRYPVLSGDSTTWIPRGEYNRKKTYAEWMLEYGEQDISYEPPETIQMEVFSSETNFGVPSRYRVG